MSLIGSKNDRASILTNWRVVLMGRPEKKNNRHNGKLLARKFSDLGEKLRNTWEKTIPHWRVPYWREILPACREINIFPGLLIGSKHRYNWFIAAFAVVIFFMVRRNNIEWVDIMEVERRNWVYFWLLCNPMTAAAILTVTMGGVSNCTLGLLWQKQCKLPLPLYRVSKN